jgi:hypothetical protein
MPAVREGVSRWEDDVGIARPRVVAAPEQVARTARRPELFRSPSVWRATPRHSGASNCEGKLMHGLIYLVGLIVVIMAVLSLFGLR